MAEVMIDCVYIAASTLDARFTRTCVASVRRFYPEIPVRLLVGGRLQAGLADELRRYWDVQIDDDARRDYGYGFVKLEPLFGPPGEKFLVLDSDTALAGPVLDSWQDCDAPFLVDNEPCSDSAIRSDYYDWQRVREVDSRAQPPSFVFNSGQWVGTAGLISRDEVATWIEWTTPPRVRHPHCFFSGEEGILNYLVNQKSILGGLRVERRAIMRCPDNPGGLEGLTAATVAAQTAPAVIIHWAGIKRLRLRDIPGADVLSFFEEMYYERLPWGVTRRRVAASQNALAYLSRPVEVRLRRAVNRAAPPWTGPSPA